MATKTHRVGLTRRSIVVAAVAIADTDGLHALSMRKLARALGVEAAMSLYNHIEGIDDLYGAMLDHILDEDLEQVVSGEDAETVLTAMATAFRERGKRHASMLALITRVDRHSTAVLNSVRSAISRLTDTGLGASEAVTAYQVLTSFAIGFMIQERNGTVGLTCCAPGDESDFPDLRSAAAQVSAADADRAFEFGLHAAIRGMQQLARER